ncbi:MAG: outer membrane protein [Pseudomonadota bacterium]
MKKLATIVAPLAVICAGTATAADLAPRVYTKAPVIDPVFNWTGFYLGAHAGYLAGRARANAANTAAITATYGRMPKPEGGFAGIQGGYNYQFANRIVLGIEASVEGFGIDGMKDSLGIPPGSALSVSTDWAYSVVGRLGYAIDRWLPYAFAGVIGVHDKESGFNPFIGAFALQNTHTGWTAGAGVEYAFTRNWSARLQYRYADIDKQQYNLVRVGGTGSSGDIGFNYRF